MGDGWCDVHVWGLLWLACVAGGCCGVHVWGWCDVHGRWLWCDVHEWELV